MAQVALPSCNGGEFRSGAGAGGDGAGASTAGESSGGGSKAAGGSGPQGGKSASGGAANGGTQASGGQNNPGGAGDSEPSAGGAESEPGFQPPSVGLLYWFSADVGVTAEEGTVTSWKNRAGAGISATQVLTVAQPKLEQADILPLPLVTFDGEDDFLELPELDASWVDGLSVFVVARSGPATTCSALIELSNGEELNDINVASEETAVRYEIDQAVLEAEAGTFPIGEVRLVEVHHSPGADPAPVELRVNGGQAGSTVMPRPIDVPRISNFLGRSLYGSCVPFSGGIAELLMFSRKVSSDERLAIELYLIEKWQCCQ